MGERAELLAAVARLAPEIAAAADETERARRLPQRLVDAFARAGFFRMLVPRAFGGLECDPQTAFEVVEAVARVDGSAGWIVMIGTGTPAFIAPYVDDAVGYELFQRDPNAVLGGAIGTRGRAVAVEGGYRVSGRWAFGSGAEHCAWLASGCAIYDGDTPRLASDGQPARCVALTPRADVQILDTWSVAGLRGTGSHDYVLEDVFVPAAYAPDPITQPRRQAGPLYSAHFMLTTHAAQALGVARHALDAFTAQASGPPERPAALGGRPLAQLRLAQAEALVSAARAYVLATTEDAWTTATTDGAPSAAQRAQIRLAMTHAVQSAAQAVDLVRDAAGASAIYTTSPIERCYRDIHVATQHAVVATTSYELLGRALLGRLGPEDFVL
jgi:alkylation response protein AidB-like acyl-CoA dehydrogenase